MISDRLCGVIEADRTFFARSFKGDRVWQKGDPPAPRAPRRHGCGLPEVPVLTAMDGGAAIFDAILVSLLGIEAALDGRIAAGSVLRAVAGTAYAKVARKADAEHCIISQSATTPPRPGLDRVSAHHQMLRRLVNDRCRGGATKYLRNDLGWHRAMTKPGFEGKLLLTRTLA